MSQPLSAERFETELGAFVAVASTRGLVALSLLAQTDEPEALWRSRLEAALDRPIVRDSVPTTRRAARQVRAYLCGRRDRFQLTLDLGGTPFQRRVWEALRSVPYGETLTYGELAGLIGSPDATRAVAQACGRNPVLLAVPCHRVVAADGLGGFTAGVPVKRRLLTLERGSGHDLPLFEVATLREETAHRRESDRAVRDALPDELDAWLAHRLEGRPLPGRAARDGERWLADATEALSGARLGELAHLLAEGAVRADDTTLRRLALQLLADGWAAGQPEGLDADAADAWLRAAAVLGSRWFEAIVRQVASRPRGPAAVRRAVEHVVREVLEGLLKVHPRLRERAVDSWLALGRAPGAVALEHPTGLIDVDSLQRAGRPAEAASAAERAMAAGEGDRRLLLEALASLYLRAGDTDSARQRLVALDAEYPSHATRRRLRELDDTLAQCR